jgi:hypothetical protein
MLLNPVSNHPEHVAHVLLYVAVMKSQKAEPRGFKSALPFRVLLKFASMAIAINFNHEMQFRAIKVYDVLVDRLLTGKLASVHLSPL